MQEVVRGKNQLCCICQKKFSIFNPEHICKRCLRSVCKGCADNKSNIFQKSGERKPHRICNKCLPQSQFLDNYKSCYKVNFNVGCKIGNSWADELMKGYSKNKDAFGKIKKTPLKGKAEFWSDLNFSLRNFFGLLVENVDYFPVLKALYDRLQINNLSEFVCMFFLCHCAEQRAQDSIYAIYQILETQPADLDRVFANLKFFGCTQKQMSTMRPFVQSIFARFINNLSLNILTAQVSLFIITAFIREKTPKILQKGLATLIFILKDFICTHIDNRKTVQNEFVLNIRFNQFESNMKVIAQKEKIDSETTVQRKNSVVIVQSQKSVEEEVSRAQSVLVAPQAYKPTEREERTASQSSQQKEVLVETRNKSEDVVNDIPVRGFAKPAAVLERSVESTVGKSNEKTVERTVQKSVQKSVQRSVERNVERTAQRSISGDASSIDERTPKLSIATDDDDFDEDLQKLYEQNEKILIQTKALKKLGEQLLKEIDQM